MSDSPILPKTIWILWLQGYDQAPTIVQRCIDSWGIQNPGWQVRILDSHSLQNLIDFDIHHEKIRRLLPATQSDLVRLSLLSQFGGVWADATAFCTTPLDSWLPDCMASGFFAFHKPGRDRILSTWFLAAPPHNHLIEKWYGKFHGFWLKHDLYQPDGSRAILIRHLSRILNRSHRTTRFWFCPLFTEYLQIYPYSSVHYIFEQLIRTDPQADKIWKGMKQISANEPHSLQVRGLGATVTDEIRKQIDDREIPIYKLAWKYKRPERASETVLDYLFASHQQPPDGEA